MVPINEQIKAIQVSIKGIAHELKNESLFPPIKRELLRRQQCLEDTIKTLTHLAPLLDDYKEIDERRAP